jgi:hypothetical protein
MNARRVGGLLIIASGLMCRLASPSRGASTQCTMRFDLKGWSAFYKTASGSGTVTCDNGQSANVIIRAKGGGLTVGKSRISDGHGKFSEVTDIGEIYGGYGSAEAHAGMVRSTTAQVMTKGPVSLELTGKGEGVDLGIAFGKFTTARHK